MKSTYIDPRSLDYINKYAAKQFRDAQGIRKYIDDDLPEDNIITEGVGKLPIPMETISDDFSDENNYRKEFSDKYNLANIQFYVKKHISDAAKTMEYYETLYSNYNRTGKVGMDKQLLINKVLHKCGDDEVAIKTYSKGKVKVTIVPKIELVSI